MNNVETEIDKKKNENTTDSNKNKQALSTLKKRMIYFILFLLVGTYSLYSSKLAHLKLIYNNVLHYTNKKHPPPISNVSNNVAFLNYTTITEEDDTQVKMAEKVSPDLKGGNPQDQLNRFKGDYKPETKESMCGGSQSGGATTTKPLQGTTPNKTSSSTTVPATSSTSASTIAATTPTSKVSTSASTKPSQTMSEAKKSVVSSTGSNPSVESVSSKMMSNNSEEFANLDEVSSDCNVSIMAVKNYFWAVIFNIYEQLCVVNQKYFGMLYDNCSEEVILFIMPIITLFYLMGLLLYCKILVVWFLFSNLSIVWKESMLYTILILCVLIPFISIIMVGMSLFILIYSVVSVFKVKLNKLPVNQDSKKIDYSMLKMLYDVVFTKKRIISFILSLFVILFVQSTIGTPYAMLVSVVVFLIYKEIFFKIPIFKNTTPLELFKYEPPDSK